VALFVKVSFIVEIKDLATMVHRCGEMSSFCLLANSDIRGYILVVSKVNIFYIFKCKCKVLVGTISVLPAHSDAYPLNIPIVVFKSQSWFVE